MIYLLQEKATFGQMQEMLREYESMVKIVVDVRRKILAGGGEMNSDCEALLLDDGSEQDDLWGANWYPEEERIAFESLINIRPRLGNHGVVIQDDKIRRQIEEITRQILGGVK